MNCQAGFSKKLCLFHKFITKSFTFLKVSVETKQQCTCMSLNVLLCFPNYCIYSFYSSICLLCISALLFFYLSSQFQLVRSHYNETLCIFFFGDNFLPSALSFSGNSWGCRIQSIAKFQTSISRLQSTKASQTEGWFISWLF